MTRLYSTVAGLVSEQQAGELERLLVVPEGTRVSELERLRTPPTKNTPTELVGQVDRLGELRGFGLRALDVSTIPPNRLSWLARYGIGSKASTIRALTPERKTATLVAMLRTLTGWATDDALDVFDALVRENLIRRAERESQQARLRSLPQLSRASITLAAGLKTMLGLLTGDEADSAQADVRRVVDADSLLAALEGPSLWQVAFPPRSACLTLRVQFFLTDVDQPDSGNFTYAAGSHRLPPTWVGDDVVFPSDLPGGTSETPTASPSRGCRVVSVVPVARSCP